MQDLRRLALVVQGRLTWFGGGLGHLVQYREVGQGRLQSFNRALSVGNCLLNIQDGFLLLVNSFRKFCYMLGTLAEVSEVISLRDCIFQVVFDPVEEDVLQQVRFKLNHVLRRRV